ncbi:MAG: hypothetical protein WBB85_21015 [Albidovulum sp.]|uniref:hypothetical protein n=1 Tax=Albidovulum sp. TaxID=1872424 RepID=UPI003CA13420
MDADIEADFFNPQIDELPLHYIQDWYFAAYDPKGVAKSTWSYLLPRILEILAIGEDVSNVALEVSLNRFETGNRDNWTSDEWKILDEFQRHFLKREIESKTENYLDDTICMFRLAGWPLKDLLEQVVSTSDVILAQRFWNDWCNGVVPGRESIWITAFWDDPDKTTVFDFYTSKALYTRMESLVFADNTDPEISTKALAVAGVIEANATSDLSS